MFAWYLQQKKTANSTRAKGLRRKENIYPGNDKGALPTENRSVQDGELRVKFATVVSDSAKEMLIICSAALTTMMRQQIL